MESTNLILLPQDTLRAILEFLTFKEAAKLQTACCGVSCKEAFQQALTGTTFHSPLNLNSEKVMFLHWLHTWKLSVTHMDAIDSSVAALIYLLKYGKTITKATVTIPCNKDLKFVKQEVIYMPNIKHLTIDLGRDCQNLTEKEICQVFDTLQLVSIKNNKTNNFPAFSHETIVKTWPMIQSIQLTNVR